MQERDVETKHWMMKYFAKSIHGVNETFNLALLVPFLTVVLLCYFSFFGLFFDTFVYGVFDLNYLKYGGFTDFFISMFRTGGVLTVVVLKFWVLYAVILAVIFCIWLFIKLILVTAHHRLKMGRRLKIIGLGMGVFVLNFLHMFGVLIPKRDRRHPSQILIGREHLIRSIMKQAAL